MQAYVYKAAWLCEECGEQAIADLGGKANCPALVDSDAWPHGPLNPSTEEADCPQSCDRCGLFLENGLTDDGADYVRERAKQYEVRPDMTWSEIAQEARDSGADVVAEWIEYYLAPGM